MRIHGLGHVARMWQGCGKDVSSSETLLHSTGFAILAASSSVSSTQVLENQNWRSLCLAPGPFHSISFSRYNQAT